jgi:hypothetical protein
MGCTTYAAIEHIPNEIRIIVATAGLDAATSSHKMHVVQHDAVQHGFLDAAN